MSCRVFVGNLPWRVTSDDLAAMVADMGHAARSVRVVADRETGRSRGFAFVEVDTPAALQDLVRDLDGHVVDGRPLRANEAEEKPRGGGGRGGGRTGGGGRGSRPRRGGDGQDTSWDDTW